MNPLSSKPQSHKPAFLFGLGRVEHGLYGVAMRRLERLTFKSSGFRCFWML